MTTEHPSAAGETDADLLSRVGAGDLSSLGVLYDRHHGSVLGFVKRSTADSAHADDLAHESFLMLARIATRYDGRASARPLLLGIAAQLVRKHRRREARGAAALQWCARTAGERGAPTPEMTASVTEEMRRLEAALTRLSEEKRVVVILVECEGLSGEEAARALEIPPRTVWTRLHYARRELRAALGRERDRAIPRAQPARASCSPPA